MICYNDGTIDVVLSICIIRLYQIHEMWTVVTSISAVCSVCQCVCHVHAPCKNS